MTESEIAAEADREAAASCGVLTEFEAAEAAFARCHAITGHGPERCMICDAWPCSCVWEDAPQPTQSGGVNPMPRQSARMSQPVPNRIAELEMLVASLSAAVDASDRERDAAETAALIHKRDAAELERQVADLKAHNSSLNALSVQQHARFHGAQEHRYELEQRAALLEAMLDATTAQRDHAVLRMKAAIATSHAWIDAEVRRRSQLLGIPEHVAPAFPANALRQQRQTIGLLSTADAGRVWLGGYAPSLPPR
jgi:hypothetical protein